MNVQVKDDNTIVLPAVMTIAEAESFHGALDDAIKTGESYTIDASQVERVDTSVMQQLICFQAELKRHDRELSFGEVSDPFANAVRLLGLGHKINI